MMGPINGWGPMKTIAESSLRVGTTSVWSAPRLLPSLASGFGVCCDRTGQAVPRPDVAALVSHDDQLSRHWR